MSESKVKTVTINVPRDLQGFTEDRLVKFLKKGFDQWVYRTKRNKEQAAIMKEIRSLMKARKLTSPEGLLKVSSALWEDEEDGGEE